MTSLTYPILLGYVSVGFIFGILAHGENLPFAFAVSASLFLYAGAAQFLILSLIQAEIGLSQIFLAILLLNLRHVFYFKPVAKKMPKNPFKKLYSILALTDESFAVLTEPKIEEQDTFLICLFDHSYWIIGTVLGFLSGHFLGKKIEGLEFSLLALFIVLLVEKTKFKLDWDLLCISLAICIGTWIFIPSGIFLIFSMLLCLTSVVVRDWKKHG